MPHEEAILEELGRFRWFCFKVLKGFLWVFSSFSEDFLCFFCFSVGFLAVFGRFSRYIYIYI